MAQSMVLTASVGCPPFGGTGPGAVEPLPALVIGSLVGGRGGSTTLSAVSTGFGASAGGKSCFAMTAIRLPGITGDMYNGMFLYAKHRFPVDQHLSGKNYSK